MYKHYIRPRRYVIAGLTTPWQCADALPEYLHALADGDITHEVMTPSDLLILHNHGLIVGRDYQIDKAVAVK